MPEISDTVRVVSNSEELEQIKLERNKHVLMNLKMNHLCDLEEARTCKQDFIVNYEDNEEYL